MVFFPPRQAEEQAENGRHPREPGHLFLDHPLDDYLGIDKIFLEDEGAAETEYHEQLVEPVIEGKRQDAEHNILFRVLQIGGDGGDRGVHVEMGHHHPFGIAGAAGGIDESGQIDVDNPWQISPDRRRGENFSQRRGVRPLLAGRIEHDHPEPGEIRTQPLERQPARPLRNEDGGAAIPQHIDQLVVLGGGIEADKDPSRHQDGIDRHTGIGRIIHVEQNPVAAPDADADQMAGQAISRRPELRIAQRNAARLERNFAGMKRDILQKTVM